MTKYRHSDGKLELKVTDDKLVRGFAGSPVLYEEVVCVVRIVRLVNDGLDFVYVNPAAYEQPGCAERRG